ncbi:MAG: hypothetical protein ACK5MB_05530 [Phycisphaerales bacterium]
MPSSYSVSFRLNLQAPGENLNTWGTNLNAGVFQLIEDALAGAVSLSLSGPTALTSVNGATDQARCMALNITGGTGGTITVPGVRKLYFVRNTASGAVVITTGSGATASFAAGEVGFCYSPDGVNFYRTSTTTDFAGARLQNVGSPTANTDSATKGYVDGVAFAMAAGSLPGQPGNAGRFLTTNGATASWDDVTVTTSQITDYASDQAAKAAAATRLSVAFAAAL